MHAAPLGGLPPGDGEWGTGTLTPHRICPRLCDPLNATCLNVLRVPLRLLLFRMDEG